MPGPNTLPKTTVVTLAVTTDAGGNAILHCPANTVATGGGGNAGTHPILASVPVGGSPPTGWEIGLGSANAGISVTVDVVCVPTS